MEEENHPFFDGGHQYEYEYYIKVSDLRSDLSIRASDGWYPATETPFKDGVLIRWERYLPPVHPLEDQV